MANERELERYLKILKATESENDSECPVKCTLDIIGGRWKLKIFVTSA